MATARIGQREMQRGRRFEMPGFRWERASDEGTPMKFLAIYDLRGWCMEVKDLSLLSVKRAHARI